MDMTTSRETDWMDHPTLRRLVDEINGLSIDERLTLVKGLVPGIAAELRPAELARFGQELRLKADRFYEAKQNPGSGRATRLIPGEREVEGR
jgi:hypothetical protein